VQHWQLPFLGLSEIPAELTEFEIRYFFTLTAKEREAVFSRHGNHHRLAVALQIGMIKMAGRTLDGSVANLDLQTSWGMVVSQMWI
jgi:hypothetical protein